MELLLSRLIRLWLVVLIPIGLFLGFNAYSLNNKLQFGNGISYYELMGGYRFPVKSGITEEDYGREYYQENYKYSDDIVDKRNPCLVGSFVLLLFPLLLKLICTMYRFVMFGKAGKNSP